MDQQIRFCATPDGVRIAYATLGDGPPAVYVAGWPTHIELEWERPAVRDFLTELARGVTLVRYDMRGAGLSDRDVDDFSLDALVRDLAAVIDHVGFERVPLISLGVLAGPTAVTYAARCPERVSHLVLCSAYLHGERLTSHERQQALIDYASRFGFPVFDFVDAPDVDIETQRQVRKLQEEAASREVQAALMRTLFGTNISDVVARVTTPAMVIHGRGDRMVPFTQGRELAALLPSADFVPVEGNTGAAWTQRNVVIPALRRFIGVDAGDTAAPSDLVTVMFTDLASSTELTQRLGDAGAQELVRAHDVIVRRALRAHGGSEIKHTGDGIMASFPTASRAIEAALAVQQDVARERQEHPDRPLAVHIGLNAGEPVAESSDLFGTVVQLARRVCDEAAAGEVLVSNVVRELAAGKPFAFEDRGERSLKGFDEPVRLYAAQRRETTER